LFTDEQSQIDLHVVDFAKVLADINSINDDDVLSITKVLSSELSNISEISIIDFNKFRSDQVDTSDLFDRTVSFNRSLTDTVLQPDLAALSVDKPLSDAIGHFDGPVQYDSDGWAVDYVVNVYPEPGYIFDTRVVFDVIKALSDINSTSDNDVIDFTKGLADLIDPQDNDVIDFTKARADETITLDDDILDFTGASASLGKPAQADMILGLATAPILIASESVGELRPIIQRKFKEKGDVQKALTLALKTDCVKKSYELAEFHAQRAVEALQRLPASDARSALLRILHVAISRDK
jgi:hypothetical protein